MKEVNLDINISRIANFIDSHIESLKPFKEQIPPFSSIEFSNNQLCNRRCVFCPRVDTKLFPNKNGHLSFSLFEKIMKELRKINYTGRISFSGFCEPLMTKNFEKYILLGKESCPEMTIEISSNGDFLTLDFLKIIFAAGLDNLRISLYDGVQQEKKFIEMKKQLGLSDKQFILRRRYLGPKESYGLTISNRAGAIFLKNEYLTLEPLKEPFRQPCYYPFYKMMVDYNGDVMICSNDWLKKLIVGNLNHQSIIEVWLSEGFMRARKNLVNGDRNFFPCSKCNVNGLYNGREHFEAWLDYYNRGKKS